MTVTKTIGTYEVMYNLEALKKATESLQFEDWTDNGNTGDDNGYTMTEEDFKKGLSDFILAIDKLPETLEAKFKAGVKLTKKGQFDRRKNHVIMESGLITNYSDHYGSHSYDTPSIVAYQVEPGKAVLAYEEVSHQDSF